ncbi:MAG: TAXI family TRAP transporter solute-binding subunit [Eubacterium sp.]
MNKKLKLILTGVIAAAMIVSMTGCRYVSHALKFGTARKGGIYQEFGAHFANILNHKDSALQVTTRRTAGSESNIRLLNEDYIQLTLAQNDMATAAYYGKGNYKGKKPMQNFRAIAGLYTEQCQIVVREDSKITTIEDLEGKKVSTGEKESGTSQNAKEILSAYGLSSKTVHEQHLSYSKAMQALKDKKIDAVFITAGAKTDAISNLNEKTPVRLLSIDTKHQKRILKANPYMVRAKISANTYDGQTDDIQTVGVRCVFLVKKNLPEATVKEITEFLFQYKDHMQGKVSAHLDYTPKKAVEGITIPFHKGAADYYKSKGITVKTK